MSIHKLTAGSGYDYLTRQVAALDATDKGHTGLSSYYTERGEAPGVWVGAGMTGIDGLDAGDVVTAEQMQALFGSGFHPLAHERTQAETLFDEELPTRLGAPFKVYDGDVGAFRLEVAQRLTRINTAAGLPSDWPIPVDQRAAVRTEVARDFFRAEHGRDPRDAREVAATIAKHSRPKTTAVAGYDLTFSPVKSVSTLWAIAPPEVAARVELAHQAATADALRFIETHALYTRTGTNGTRQVDVRGIVATAFTHRDSRAGDPDLHTHVAIANKVQTLDRRWLSIDGRVLFKATVTASETYNTSLEKHLRADLGVRFAERPGDDPRKRPIREIVGVDPALNTAWSSRRADIEARRGQLSATFQATHGRPPTPVESIQLAQQATLETRDAKHEPRTLAQQRATWHAQAEEVLGGPEQIATMIAETLAPPAVDMANRPDVSDPDWVAEAAVQVLGQVEQRRSTWQTWHVRAEAQRQVRAANPDPDLVDDLVDQVVDQVLETRSVSLARGEPGIVEPAPLRRRDGASVYTVAGSALYTSARVLEAEQRLVDAAGRRDGRIIDATTVDIALLESAANGVELNTGQAHLVRELATSGARLQLAIAPAGTGKTTTMRALSQAWAGSGGHVLGLAPSAAAAAALADHTGIHTDTLAKLLWSLDSGDAPDWVGAIGPETLVVIDEAGMADTLSLDRAVAYALSKGASVRLIGDDQQLAAIGAGGVLRDIHATHGSVRLTELMRFTEPAEAAATLALRDGRSEALGFYLDRGRVHVGDMATMSSEVFQSWTADRANGLDAIMLAPTRDLVAELNRQARQHRLAGATTTGQPAVQLADGNEATTGDVVLTRRNDRRLRQSATDWVKNGDRWTVLDVGETGTVRAQHAQTGRVVTLPADYVASAVELGYAVTVHAAQGVSVDTMHGLATGSESRQQLYTMMTRGRLANHVYLDVAGDGDPHAVIHPDVTHPRTATDILERILTRDDTPLSASTTLRELDDPALQLGPATSRYLDALYQGAEHTLGTDAVDRLEQRAEAALPGITAEPAWPALRAHLILLGSTGTDPITALHAATGWRETDTAADRAAVLDWRLDETGLRNAGPGPLPWTPATPASLLEDAQWGPYLQARQARVRDLATQVRTAARDHGVPDWAAGTPAATNRTLLAELATWRAATEVPNSDRRPTGPPQLQKAPARWQARLDDTLGSHDPAVREWAATLRQLAPATRHDPFTSLLSRRLCAVAGAGLEAHALLVAAAAESPLPDDHAAGALWWRISAHLSPAVLADTHNGPVSTTWTEQLTDLVGQDRATSLQQDALWPVLVATIDQALQRGWQLPDLLAEIGHTEPHVEECQSLVWRVSVLLDPPPAPEEHTSDETPPPVEDETWWTPPAGDVGIPGDDWHAWLTNSDPDMSEQTRADPRRQESAMSSTVEHHHAEDIDIELGIAAAARSAAYPLEPTDAQLGRIFDNDIAWREATVSRERLLAINSATAQFYRTHLATDRSWVRGYLHERFGTDVAGDVRFGAGHAPAGWTHLVDHLRGHGFTDEEALQSGVATVARTGRLIDRFRDRVVFPIARDGEILGFIGRRHPDLADGPKAGPKYLNTADTLLFSKGAQLYLPTTKPDPLAVPVLVEGPIDAVAVTLATGGSHVGVAPLGTSFTNDQAEQLLHAFPMARPVVATDADIAGHVAAEKAYWTLQQHHMDPLAVRLPPGSDPAQILHEHGAEGLARILVATRPLADVLIDERTENLPPDRAGSEAINIIAARPPHDWDTAVQHLATLTEKGINELHRLLLPAARSWTQDPRSAADKQLAHAGAVRERLTNVLQQPPENRWAPLAQRLHPPLLSEPDWPALATLIDQTHQNGHDVELVLRGAIADEPLGALPAQDLRYRLATTLAVPEVPPPLVPERRATHQIHRGQELDKPESRPEAPPR